MASTLTVSPLQASDLRAALQALNPYRDARSALPLWTAVAARDGDLYVGTGSVFARTQGRPFAGQLPDGAWYLHWAAKALPARGALHAALQADGALRLTPPGLTVPAVPPEDAALLVDGGIHGDGIWASSAQGIGVVPRAVWDAARVFAARDTIRPVLQGILVDVRADRTWRCAATDGTRLVEWVSDIPVVGDVPAGAYVVPAVPLPPGTMITLALLRGRDGQPQGVEWMGTVAVRARPLDGRYPDFDHVMPTEDTLIGEQTLAADAWAELQQAYAAARRLVPAGRVREQTTVRFAGGGAAVGVCAVQDDPAAGAMELPALVAAESPLAFAFDLLTSSLVALPGGATTLRLHRADAPRSWAMLEVRQQVDGGRLRALVMALRDLV